MEMKITKYFPQLYVQDAMMIQGEIIFASMSFQMTKYS